MSPDWTDVAFYSAMALLFGIYTGLLLATSRRTKIGAGK